MSGAWGQNPQPPEARGCGAEPPATENFCIFYPEKVILVLCTMYYTNTKCSDM